MKDYVENARKFLEKVGAKMTINYSDCVKNPWGDSGYLANAYHNQYKVIITRNGKRMTVNFTDSVYNTENGEEPTEYDILACLEKYDVGSFEDFCLEFGYDTDSRKAEKTYKAVVKEYNNVMRVFGDVIDELAEIQ